MVKKIFFLQCIKTVRFHNEIKSPSSVLLGTSGGPATLGRTTLGGSPPSTLFVIQFPSLPGLASEGSPRYRISRDSAHKSGFRSRHLGITGSGGF